MIDVSGLKQLLDSKLPTTLEILKQMVEINSFTTNIEGVDRLGRLTSETFAPLGFSPEFIRSANPRFGSHLVMTRPGRSGKSIALISHLDTVFPPEEEARNDFRWSVEGDRIFGPGTHDIKGGTAMMWLVLSALQAQAPDVFEDITWTLLWNSSEECYSPDFGKICRSRLNVNTLAALVFEAEGRLGNEHLMVVARKGRATWRVTVNGRGAHSGGNHGHGVNAVVQAGRLVEKISALTDYARELTVNVATINGGTVLNRVPHEVVVEGEFRAFKPEVYEHAKAALLAMRGKGDLRAKSDGHTCEINVEILTESNPWPRNPGSDRLCEIWRQAGELAGYPTNHQERGGLSDGNQLWDVVPTLDGLGPWGENDHCSERSADGSKLPEYVEISTFVPKATANILAMAKLAGSAN